MPTALLAEATGKLQSGLLPDLARIAPEAFLCAMVVVVLAVDLLRGRRGPSKSYAGLTLGGIVVAIGGVFWSMSREGGANVGYAGCPAMRADQLASVFKLIFLATGALTVLFIGRSREAYGREAELSILMFGALAGMCYLASATELIGFYL